MPTVAIIGAGELGGAVAHALAAGDRASRVLLIDDAASAAAGKALDIQQMGSVDGFHTRLAGTADLTRVIGCAVCIVADRFDAAAGEWQGEAGIQLVGRVVPLLGQAPLLFAGSAQAALIAAAVRDWGLPRAAAVGSAPEAMAGAVRAIVALEARCAAREVALGVLGAPGRFVIPWSEASIGGYPLERVLSQVQLARLEARAPRLWPPGPYALGLAAARVAEAMLLESRQARCVFTLLDDTGGAPGGRLAALPAQLGTRGIVALRAPALSARERVLVESALG